MTEGWKIIDGHGGAYSVSSHGRVRNNFTGKIMAQSNDKDGYLKIKLSIGGERTYRVHRLVAVAFIGNAHELPEVNHKDENKKNNSVTNLEWCSSYYNQCYGTRVERCLANFDPQKCVRRMAEKNKRPVISITQGGKVLGYYQSILDAAAACEVDSASIVRCCKGKAKSAGRLLWRYA